MAEELKALPEAIWIKFLGGAASLAKAFREGIPGGEAAGAISEGRLPSRESLTPNLGTLTDRALDAGRRLEGEARAAWNRLRGRDDG